MCRFFATWLNRVDAHKDFSVIFSQSTAYGHRRSVHPALLVYSNRKDNIFARSSLARSISSSFDGLAKPMLPKVIINQLDR